MPALKCPHCPVMRWTKVSLMQHIEKMHPVEKAVLA